MRLTKLFLYLHWLMIIPVFAGSDGVLNIDIVGGREGSQPIAIVPFHNATGKPLPEDLRQIITNNLYRTGKFAPLSIMEMPEKPHTYNQIHFSRWQKQGTPHLVIGEVKGKENNYTVNFKLFSVFNEQQLTGFSYPANEGSFRQIAHQISDIIYQSLTGEKGIFSTKIVYITVRRDQNQRPVEYKLYVADADGANSKIMLKSSEPIFSPAWSNDGRRIAYVSLEKKKTTVYIQDIRTGTRQAVSNFPGLNTAPAWSPNGQQLALSLSKDGNPEIYVLNLQSNRLQRITQHPAIDTEPEWSKDGKSLVFTSDRSGRPQIYHTHLQRDKTQRVTFTGNYNARPRFSPDGEQLALIHNNGNGYRIAVLHLPSSQLNILTHTQLDESPCFAPNGSMILYSTGEVLTAMSLDGHIRQRLAVDTGEWVREPAWSPFLHN